MTFVIHSPQCHLHDSLPNSIYHTLSPMTLTYTLPNFICLTLSPITFAIHPPQCHLPLSLPNVICHTLSPMSFA